jgi:hypothetical protein
VDFVQNHAEQLELLRPGMSTGIIGIVKKMNSYFEEVSIGIPEMVLHVRLNSNEFEVGDFVDLCHLNKAGEIKKSELIFKQVSEFVKI